jgi:PhnB protein
VIIPEQESPVLRSPLAEQFWGELYGRLKDPFGHEWTIAQLLQILGSAEVENAAAAILRPREP